MTEKRIREILESVAAGRVSASVALNDLRDLPFQDLGFAKLDAHRTLRR
jgi:pyridinium-3,5-biscarboxylic acid mononucleotide synthase